MAERAERREKRRLIDAPSPRSNASRTSASRTTPRSASHDRRLGGGIVDDDRESVIFIGDSGTGKTMLATALAVCACHQGRRVRFTTLAALSNELQEAQGNRELARVVGRYAGPSFSSVTNWATWRCPTTPPSSSSRSSPSDTNAVA